MPGPDAGVVPGPALVAESLAAELEVPFVASGLDIVDEVVLLASVEFGDVVEPPFRAKSSLLWELPV